MLLKATSRFLARQTEKSGVRMTPALFVALATSGFFIFVLLVALCCLGSIQTPDQYPTRHLPGKKEF